MIGYGSAGALIFSLYIIYDTQLMMGGKHKVGPASLRLLSFYIYLHIYLFISLTLPISIYLSISKYLILSLPASLWSKYI